VSSFDKQMNVVRHEAVRNNIKSVVIGGTRQPHRHSSHRVVMKKDLNSIQRADCQEIAIETNVVERL
jgi:hypothetical protein